MLAACWAALQGDPRRLGDLEVVAAGRHLPAAFDVDGLVVGAVGSMLLAAAELAEARGLGRPALALDARHAAVAFTSERRLRDGGPSRRSAFAPLSRFAATSDGWIRLHANYDHHRHALLRALGAGEASALDAIARRTGEELEEAIVRAGGVAAAVRTPDRWSRHPQGCAATGLPLVAWRDAPAERRALVRPARDRRRPAEGLRVLDLTRVIAGPVATRTLAALGADVLRLDPPHLPEDRAILLDTCPGKRLATLDLRTDPEALHGLLAGADVLVHGYRPGALDAFGLGDEALAVRHPHLVVCALSAWGASGPWSRRRGFDSIVQAACGIADAQGDGETPGALPAQALDHATGYLMAAAVLRATARRAAGEAWQSSRLALAATAAALMRHASRAEAPPPGDHGDPAPEQPQDRCDLMGDLGAASVIAPPGALDGAPTAWAAGPLRSAPSWQ